MNDYEIKFLNNSTIVYRGTFIEDSSGRFFTLEYLDDYMNFPLCNIRYIKHDGKPYKERKE